MARQIKSNMTREAAAIMIWSGGAAHAGAEASRYMRMLDVKGGQAIVGRCERIWPHYGEVIRDRKRCIADLAVRHLRGGRIEQAVVLGAGMDPLSVEICSRLGRPITAYEVDAACMPGKRRLLARACPAAARHIRCVAADLSGSPGRIAAALEGEGWRPDLPSLVVAEGISYYLPKPRLRALLARLRTGDGSGRIILEYLRDEGSIRPDRAAIPRAVFGIYCGMIGIGKPSRYSDAQAAGLAGGGGMRGRSGHAATAAAGAIIVGPADMERRRTGKNRLFPTDDSGWIAVCHGPF